MLFTTDQLITKDQLVPKTKEMLDKGARLANLVCNDEGDGFELIYVFHEGLDRPALRIRVAKDEEVPSLSGLQLAQALIENEVKEFFGVNITDIAIDFKCQMILGAKSPKTPLLKELPVL